MSATECPACHGKRLRPESLAVKVNGMSLADFTAMSVARSLEVAREDQLRGREEIIAGRIVHEVVERLQFLNAVGLGYISLDRSAATLSGGEGQRIRLATQIGSKLRGVLYVLDEPSIGLHHRDNDRLLKALEELRDLGNTVLVVEHDEETIRRADYVIDLGPGAGRHGGELVAHGTPQEIVKVPGSLTGAYISGRTQIEMRAERRHTNGIGHQHSGGARQQSQESGCHLSAGGDDGGDGSFGIGEIYPGERHSLPGAGQDAVPLTRGTGSAQGDFRARRTSTKSFALTSRRLDARRVRTRRPIPVCSRRFAICMPCCRSRGSGDTRRDGSRSTFPADAARHARARDSGASR